jgi:4-amino-4-deoxy-L-arabinose transferase
MTTTRNGYIPLLLLAFVLAYLLPLASHGLWIPDETRYAQISQEMLHSGNWAAPHFMGLRYFEKPAAGYWMIALGQTLFGENLFGVRIASALSTGLSVLIAWLLARNLWNDPRKSFACALLYMSFGLIAGQAGYANLDPQFSLWVNLSMLAFWLAQSSTGHRRLSYWALLGVACGMGFMTKGFLAWLFPVLIALPYMVWQKRLGELIRFGCLAVIVAIAICLPWVLILHGREPDYWRFFFWHEHIRRFAADDAQHTQPIWFYLPILVVSCLPWAVLLPATIKQSWLDKRQAHIGFLLLWVLLPLAFLSISRGKLPTYIMPCLVPLALLMGHAIINLLQQGRLGALRLNGLLNALLGVVGLIALTWLQLKQPVYNQEPVAKLLLIIVLSGWVLANALQILRPARAWASPALGIGLLVALLPNALPMATVLSKTPQLFIQQHEQELASSTSLLSNDLGAASSLAWTLKRSDVVFYNTVGELEYGLSYPEGDARKVDLNSVQAWMEQARRKGSVGVVIRGAGDSEKQEIDLLPKDGKRFADGNMLILLFEQTPP